MIRNISHFFTKLSFKTLLNYLSVFIIFSGALSWYNFEFAEIRIMYFIIIFFLLYWLLILKKNLYFNKNFLLLISFIFLTSFYNVLIGRNTAVLFLKQSIGILLNALLFYLLVKFNDYDVKRLFTIYLNIAFIIALIGIFYEIGFLLKFKYAYTFMYFFPKWKFVVDQQTGLMRVNSILPEPADFANVMITACFVSIVSFYKNTFKFQAKIKSLVIIVAFILTFSPVAYIGIIVCFLLLVFNYLKNKYIILFSLTACLLISILIINDTQIRLKITQPISMLVKKNEFIELNVSSFALCSNAAVTHDSFKKNPLFGAGIGSHEISYQTYFNEVFTGSKVFPTQKQLNSKDAYSFFLRLLSETGLFGLTAFFIFIFRFYIPRKKDPTGYLWIISNAVLSMFFFKLIRMGNYFVDGFFFFVWMYYFAKLKAKNINTNLIESGTEI